MGRYIGLDAHASSCTVAVVGPSGQRLASHVVETNARAIVQVIRAVPKDRHLCLEEGTLAGWLFEILSSHVQEIVVTGVPQSRGPKNDKRDAFALAEMLRIGTTPTKVYKKRGQFTRLVQLRNDRIGSNRNQQRFRTPPTPWLQGRASIEILVPARPESPRIGYAPLKNQMKQWANESLMEGWFPLKGGERPSWNVPWPRITTLSCQHQPPNQGRSAGIATADAGCKTSRSRRDGEVCLDSLPHGRNF